MREQFNYLSDLMVKPPDYFFVRKQVRIKARADFRAKRET